MEDLRVMKSPQLWPQFPFLRVERRLELRPGSPFCFVWARNEIETEPNVLMGPTWPPDEDLDIEETYRFAYDSVEAIAAEGWRVVYLF